MSFDTWQDGSGEIDLDELRTVMTSLGYSPTDKQLEDMMAKVHTYMRIGTVGADVFCAMNDRSQKATATQVM